MSGRNDKAEKALENYEAISQRIEELRGEISKIMQERIDFSWHGSPEKAMARKERRIAPIREEIEQLVKEQKGYHAKFREAFNELSPEERAARAKNTRKGKFKLAIKDNQYSKKEESKETLEKLVENATSKKSKALAALKTAIDNIDWGETTVLGNVPTGIKKIKADLALANLQPNEKESPDHSKALDAFDAHADNPINELFENILKFFEKKAKAHPPKDLSVRGQFYRKQYEVLIKVQREIEHAKQALREQAAAAQAQDKEKAPAPARAVHPSPAAAAPAPAKVAAAPAGGAAPASARPAPASSGAERPNDSPSTRPTARSVLFSETPPSGSAPSTGVQMQTPKRKR